MDREFRLDACGQQWRIRYLPASEVIPRRKAVDAWRAEVGDVFVEVPYVEGEARPDLECRLLAAICGRAYRGVA
jgi:hypothetical protein